MRFLTTCCPILFAALLCVAVPSCATSPDAKPSSVKPSVKEFKPPELFYRERELSEEEQNALPLVTQPAKLKEALEAIDSGSLEDRVARLKKKALEDLIFVKGGQFLMGDWGGYFGGADGFPAHTVNVSGFYISRYQVTYAEFDTYTDATKTPRTAESRYADRRSRHPRVPAGATWQRARDYCQWVGQVTGLPFDLPTEAQWEYAARSRGLFVLFPTDDGTIQRGRNVPGGKIHRERMRVVSEEDYHRSNLYPIGMFPPNPIGLYDLSHNGHEWMLDWYDAEYYKHSPTDDPKGPETGEKKTVRSGVNHEDLGYQGLTASRYADTPDMMVLWIDEWKQSPVFDKTLRCVVNTDKRLRK